MKAFLLFLISALIFCSCNKTAKNNRSNEKIPLIVVTDLYHPYQDPGDNLELINAYALSNLHLKAVILDCYGPFLQKKAEQVSRGLIKDENGPREPGFVCVEQLNYIFNRNVPAEAGPCNQMKSKEDKMEDIPEDQNLGIQLFKKVLQDSDKPVTIASFGSTRVISVAFNRYPNLMREKVERIHLSAGTSSNDPKYLEWNVALDTMAFVALLESNLPISIYPCAAGAPIDTSNTLANAFKLDSNNTYYQLNSLSFLDSVPFQLKQYCYALFTRYNYGNPISYLDKENITDLSVFSRTHHVWESAIWMNIAQLSLVQTGLDDAKIVPRSPEYEEFDIVKERMVPCEVEVNPSGIFKYHYNENGRYLIYERNDPLRYQKLMNKAIPKLYKSITIN